jgi:hypothetical protein
MYCLYERHVDATGKLVLTELRLSSTKAGEIKMNWFSKREKDVFDIIRGLLKSPPTAKRSYDNDTKIWTYFDEWGDTLFTQLKAVFTPDKLEFVDVEDLAAQCVNNFISPNKNKVPKAEDFFYNHGAAGATSSMTKESIVNKLAALLEVTPVALAATETNSLKTLYRKAALRLHPDRNNGDGSRMSDLNMYWRVYNA